MELILKEDIKGLGFKNDVVNVKPGYGRNYLIPQGLALVATESSKKVVAENVKQAAHKSLLLLQAKLHQIGTTHLALVNLHTFDAYMFQQHSRSQSLHNVK